MRAAHKKFLAAMGGLVIVTVGAMASCGVPLDGFSRSEDADGEENEQLVPNIDHTGSCGTERWAVKTGTDPDNGKVDLNNPQDTTIATLVGLTKPSSLPSDSCTAGNCRIEPTETTVWRIKNVTLTHFISESDSDYHMVIQDASGKTMIIEASAPTCINAGSYGAPFLPLATTVRGQVSSSLVGQTVSVMGVGFFDFLHGQTGVAPNGVELHALLGICTGENCTVGPTGNGPTPTPTATASGTGTETPTPTGSGTPTPSSSPTPTPDSGTGITTGGCSCDLSGKLPPPGIPGVPAFATLLLGLAALMVRRKVAK